MTVVAILQARLSSTRLPGKVLLPVGGVPTVVLAALRAANRGMDVIVATSTHPTDDAVARIVADHGLVCSRGPLDDTLRRFVHALVPYQDNDIVVRLTADNVLPDGQLIGEMVEDFHTRSLDYLICSAGTSGLPYGVSAEVMRVGGLREADRSTDSAYDREHVTPFVIRRSGAAQFVKHQALGLDIHRATIDQLSDYVRMAALFADIEDPLHLPAIELSHRIARLPSGPTVRRPMSDLVLGTAQLGLPYGVANTTGRPSEHDAGVLLRTAITNGVRSIDTARSYGDSEEVIGAALAGGWESRADLITKISTLSEWGPDTQPAVISALVDKSVFESCRALRLRTLPVVLLHRVSHLRDWRGSAWVRLQQLRDQGVIRNLGVSVQSPAELAEALDTPNVVHIQFPFNLLDWRWDEVLPRLVEARSLRGTVVHVRSALLQGLVVSRRPELWARAGVPESAEVLDWLQRTATRLGRLDVADLALAYARAQPWCDGVVVGMETPGQLSANMRSFEMPPLTADEVLGVRQARPMLNARSLDPAQWESPA